MGGGAWLASAAMAACPPLTFVPQYMTIRRRRSLGAFSTTVCLVMLVAHILRLAFWSVCAPQSRTLPAQ